LRSESNPTSEYVINNFPFAKFFSDAPQPLFKNTSYAEDLEIARGCIRRTPPLLFTALHRIEKYIR
jgi:intron-binding protein aquarius